MPLLIGWVLRYLLPYLNNRFIEQSANFIFADYYPLILALLILTPPIYYGFILALLLLEEKDEGVLSAVVVTPIRLPWFLSARIGLYTAISLPLIYIVHEMIGVVAITPTRLLLIALAAAPAAPMISMLLTALCKNQLEGFVMGKGMGFLILFPLAMFFVPDYWHLFCAILPTYWPIIAYFTAVSEDGSSIFFNMAIVMSLLMQLTATLILYRRFKRQLYS
ncbi:MAG: hypothetical protein OXE78_09320 [Gammaproteobacteria bacterium]|nr:hypothetical protein [Gammaproteobacteria bacterium]MCY4359044.1 hypothetical protein [Gammaproteobacteria bacterium]